MQDPLFKLILNAIPHLSVQDGSTGFSCLCLVVRCMFTKLF